MSFIKKFFTHASSIIWLSTTVVLTAFLATATVLTGGTYYNVICSALGHKRAITSSGDNVGLFENDSGITTKADALANANAINQKICEEGMVLLKNDNNALPLSGGAKVSVFGQNSINLVYGGSGSAAPKSSEDNKTIFDSLSDAGFSYNPTLKSFYENDGYVRSSNPSMDSGGSATLSTGEAPISDYPQSLKDTYSSYSDAALVVFSRIAGEGWDLPRVASDDADGHYLELDTNERALLKDVCDSNCFKHVIVLINSSNMIDLGFLKYPDNPGYQSKVDGCILIGSDGGQGIMALGKILNGSVTPSGHCADTLYTDYDEDPTWQNFGDNRVTNSDTYTVNGEATLYNFVDYEEGIYFGYRYYETRGHIDGEDWYDSHVVYPFGYGLSYTSFEETLLNQSALENSSLTKDDFTVDVKVKNTGSTYSGKDVVELYASAPYTTGGIEKPYKVLVGYAKSKELAPQEEDTVHIEVNPYYFASYDADDKNGNDFKGYELEKGNYTFFVSENAHQDGISFQKTLPEDVRYEEDPVTGNEVANLFDDASDHLQENLSRSDFAGTFPKMPTAKDREVTSDWLAKENDRDSGNDETYDAMPTMDATVTTTMRDLVGKSYNDPTWDTFLNQMSFQEMTDLFNSGCYSTLMLQRLGVPGTTSFDGPTGIVAFSGDPAIYDTCYYCSECLVAQTWNVDLATEEGDAIGNECLIGNEKGDGLPYTGWYGPGVNLHRSPFGGRNTEYYSEDPFLSGRCAASVIKAVQKYGVYANVKHFCLNEEETHRDTEGKNYWVNEQALRELYLRPFEMAVKEGGSHGVMSSFTRIGQKWTGGNYNLLTKVLRQEWGFTGAVICDYHVNSYMNNKQMIYAGGDINLTADKPWQNPDSDSIGDVSVLRRAAHNLLYTVANSNAMRLDILGYKLPIWQEILFIGDGTVGVGLAVWGFFVIRRLIKKKKPKAVVEASKKTDSNKPKVS